MSYKVIKSFQDLDDNKRLYEAGEPYPREGYEPTEERIQQLSTVNNNKRQVFIKKVGEPDGQEQIGHGDREQENVIEFPKHTGGGWYLLSNGEKVQGKDEAVEAEKALKAGD